jgi:hypothetical protein
MARKQDLDAAADQLTTIVERHLANCLRKREKHGSRLGRVTAKVREKYARIVNA